MTSTKKNSRKTPDLKKSSRLLIDERYLLIPVLFLAGLVPLVMYMKKVTLTDPGNLYWDGLSVHFDIYSFYKMVLLLSFTVIGAILFFLSDKRDMINNKKYYYIFMGIYSLFVLLSALSSKYKTVAFFGFLQRYEGAFVLLSYIIILFLSMNLPTKENSIRLIFICLFVSAFLIFLLGAFQFFGMDYFKTAFFNNLITPASLKDDWSSLSSSFPSHTVFSSLYNPNYVGSYTAMLIPIILVFLVFTKRLRNKLLAAVLLLLAIINWIGCDSRAGIIGVGFTLIIMAVVFRRKIRQHWIIGIAIAVALFGTVFIVNLATNGSITNKLMNMASLSGKNASDGSTEALDKTLKGLKDLSMDSQVIKLVTEKGTLQIAVLSGQLTMGDENNKVLAANLQDNIVTLSDERFRNIKLTTKPDQGLIEIYYNDYHLFDAVFTKEGFNSKTNRWMLYRNNKSIEASGLIRNLSLGSNRGYIWSRSLPLLKDTIILGHGPDTFSLYFPQYDFLTKLKLYGTGGIFVDKAHNFYLQTALNTGIISLLALLCIFGLYIKSSVKLYFKREFDTFIPAAGLACFLAVCGYLASAVFNDSVVSVAPVFWVLLGLGAGINTRLAASKSK